MSFEVEYEGADLEAMEMASNYREWIFDLIRPYLGDSTVEVGAGTGTFSELIIKLQPSDLSLIEPSDLFGRLVTRFRDYTGPTKLKLCKEKFSEFARSIPPEKKPDSIVYINVLEHVEDDNGEVELLFETLKHGGRLILFVPAIQFLYSAFDRSIGHFRRYSRKNLMQICVRAGFKVSLIRSFDLPGIIPWAIKYRLLGSLKMEPRAIQIYDRHAVPLVRMFETAVPPPIGKNLLLISQK